MHNKKLNIMKILTILLLSISSLVFAQTTKEEFKVLSHKGSNTVNNKPLATGTKLFSTDKITVAVGGYIGLLHKSGKTLELRQAGEYEVTDISKKVGVTNTSASKRYGDFVVRELTKGDKEDVNKNYMNHLTVTGSVERGDEKLQLFLPISSVSSVNLVSNTLRLNWKKHLPGDIYSIKLMNGFEEVFFTQETTDTTFIIAVDKLTLNGENSFICIVSSKKDPNVVSDRRQIKIVKNDKLKELTEEILELNANLTEETPINYYVKGNFYRDKGLFIESAECYQKAIKADPEVTDFVQSYDALLNDNGLQNYMINKVIVTEKK